MRRPFTKRRDTFKDRIEPASPEVTEDTDADNAGDRHDSVDMANSRIFAHQLRSPASVNRLNSQFKAHHGDKMALAGQNNRHPRNFKRSHVSFGLESGHGELHTIWDYIQDQPLTTFNRRKDSNQNSGNKLPAIKDAKGKTVLIQEHENIGGH